MGWANSLVLVGLAFVLLIGVLLHLEARAQNKQFVSNKKLNADSPGAFMVGRDVK